MQSLYTITRTMVLMSNLKALTGGKFNVILRRKNITFTQAFKFDIISLFFYFCSKAKMRRKKKIFTPVNPSLLYTSGI